MLRHAVATLCALVPENKTVLLCYCRVASGPMNSLSYKEVSRPSLPPLQLWLTELNVLVHAERSREPSDPHKSTDTNLQLPDKSQHVLSSSGWLSLYSTTGKCVCLNPWESVVLSTS